MSIWIRCLSKLCLRSYTIEPLSDSNSKGKCKWNVWSISVSYEKRAVFQCVIIFVGVKFEKTLTAPVASGVLSCDAVITQQGAHLRQPCLLSKPRDQAWCLGEHRKASPMMHGPPLHSLGNNKQVTWCALHPHSHPSVILFLFPAFSLVWMDGTVPWSQEWIVMWKCHNQIWSFSHFSFSSRTALS